MIEPAYHALANKFTDVDFVKLDVDELPVSLYLLKLIIFFSNNDDLWFIKVSIFLCLW